MCRAVEEHERAKARVSIKVVNLEEHQHVVARVDFCAAGDDECCEAVVHECVTVVPDIHVDAVESLARWPAQKINDRFLVLAQYADAPPRRPSK